MDSDKLSRNSDLGFCGEAYIVHVYVLKCTFKYTHVYTL